MIANDNCLPRRSHCPCSFDTKLTDQGKQEARDAIAKAISLIPPPELLLSSPLSRALQTAEIAFEKFSGKRMALSLARERTYFASDVGISRQEFKSNCTMSAICCRVLHEP